MKKGVKEGKTRSFEARLKRLEEIVESLEDGDIPLDDVVTMFEEGMRLSKECMEYLDRTEMRLKKLGKDAGGKFTLSDEDEEE